MADQTLSAGDVDRLRSMLDELEAAGGPSEAQMGADTFAPDVGQTIAVDGSVTYDFDAHIHARGLDLDANVGIAPSNDREVRWIRQPDGGVLGQVFAYDTTSAPQRAGITLWGGAQADTFADVEASYDKVADVSEVRVNAAKRAPAQQLLLLDDLGRSNFPVLPTARRLFIEGPFLGGSFTLGPITTALTGPFTLTRPYSTFAVVAGGMGGLFAQTPQTITWAYQFDSTSSFRVEQFNAWNGGNATASWGGYCIHD